MALKPVVIDFSNTIGGMKLEISLNDDPQYLPFLAERINGILDVFGTMQRKRSEKVPYGKAVVDSYITADFITDETIDGLKYENVKYFDSNDWEKVTDGFSTDRIMKIVAQMRTLDERVDVLCRVKQAFQNIHESDPDFLKWFANFSFVVKMDLYPSDKKTDSLYSEKDILEFVSPLSDPKYLLPAWNGRWEKLWKKFLANSVIAKWIKDKSKKITLYFKKPVLCLIYYLKDLKVVISDLPNKTIYTLLGGDPCWKNWHYSLPVDQPVQQNMQKIVENM